MTESAQDDAAGRLALYDTAPIGLLATTHDGLIVHANRAFLSMTGYSGEELVGQRRFQDLLTPAARIYNETHLRPLLTLQGYLREIAVELTCVDGRRLPVLINSVLRDEGDRSPARVQTVVFDATERRSYERDLLVAKRRIERLQRISTIFTTLLTPGQVAHEAFAELVDGIKADRGILALVEPAAGELPVLDVFGAAGTPVDAWRGLHLSAIDPIAHAMRTLEGVFLEARDGYEEGVPLLTDGEPRATRVAFLPLASEGSAFGVLCLASLTARVFDRDERAFLTSFADICAQAIVRARLDESRRLGIRRADFLSALSRELDEEINVAARAQRLVDMLVPDFADFATVEIPSLGPRPIAAQHVEPALLDKLIALREQAQISADTPHSVARARATREAQLLAEIPDAMYEQYAENPTQLALLHDLAPKSYVGLPLVARDQLVGSVLLSMSTSSRRYSEDDLPFLMDVAGRAGTAIENARLLDHVRTVAQRLQLSFLPETLPRDPRFAIDAWYAPSAELMEIGGDWYDAFTLPGDRLGIVVGDVAGHELEAVLAMGQLRTALRAFALAGGTPSVVIERLSNFALSVPGALCTTVVYGYVELDTNTLKYACAGHLPPIVVAPGSPPRAIWDGRSPPLGASPGEQVAETSIELAAGTTMFFYTDGLIEQRGRSIDDGLDALIDRLAKDGAPRSAAALDELAASLFDGGGQTDDVCVVSVLLRESESQ